MLIYMTKSMYTRFIPLIILAILAYIFYFFLGSKYLTYSSIRNNHLIIKQFVIQNPLQSIAIYSLTYITITALSLPFASLLTLMGGYLFMQPAITAVVTLSATIGASIIFLSTRYAADGLLHKIDSKTLDILKNGFNKNPIEFMLFLRFLPLFPFWLVNIIPAFFSISLKNYIWTTALGILPGVFVYTQLGSGLASILKNSTKPNLINSELIVALTSLAVLTLAVAYAKHKFKKYR